MKTLKIEMTVDERISVIYEHDGCKHTLDTDLNELVFVCGWVTWHLTDFLNDLNIEEVKQNAKVTRNSIQ